MKGKITIIINIFLHQIVNDSLLTRFFCFGFFFLFIIYYLTLDKKVLTIDNFAIKSWFDILVFLLLFIIIYLGIFMFLRFRNWGKSIDLKIISYNVIDFMTTNNVAFIVITILFWLSFIIILLFFFSFIRKCICINLLKIHFYIISLYSMNMLEKNKYDLFRDKIFHYYLLITGCFCNFVQLFRKFIYKNIFHFLYDPLKIYGFELFLLKVKNYNAIIILLFLILYDSYYNNFVLTKFYYFLPFVFIYNLFIMLINLLTRFELSEECGIACYLYLKVKTFDLNYIEYENGFQFDIEDLNYIIVKINSI